MVCSILGFMWSFGQLSTYIFPGPGLDYCGPFGSCARYPACFIRGPSQKEVQNSCLQQRTQPRMKHVGLKKVSMWALQGFVHDA